MYAYAEEGEEDVSCMMLHAAAGIPTEQTQNV